jgi:methylase of polypeptide subunit release factors
LLVGGNVFPGKNSYASEDGVDVYGRITEKADQFLKRDTARMLEVGYVQGQAVTELLEGAGWLGKITIEEHFHNNHRIIAAAKTSS